jgi:hypothetical protein
MYIFKFNLKMLINISNIEADRSGHVLLGLKKKYYPLPTFWYRRSTCCTVIFYFIELDEIFTSK